MWAILISIFCPKFSRSDFRWGSRRVLHQLILLQSPLFYPVLENLSPPSKVALGSSIDFYWEIARATFLSGIDEGQLRQFIVDARNIISLSFCVTPSPTKMNRIISHLPLFPIILSKLDGSSISKIDRVHFSVILAGITTKLQPTDFLINQ